jgi:hypothetical protein
MLSEIPLQFPVRHGQVQHQEDLFYLEPKLEDKVIANRKQKENRYPLISYKLFILQFNKGNQTIKA